MLLLYSVLPSDEMAPDKYVIANWPSNVCQGHYICIHLERSPRNWIYTLMANSSEYVLSIHIGRKAQIQAMMISPGNLLKQWHVHEIITVVRLGTFVFLPRDHVIYINTQRSAYGMLRLPIPLSMRNDETHYSHTFTTNTDNIALKQLLLSRNMWYTISPNKSASVMTHFWLSATTGQFDTCNNYQKTFIRSHLAIASLSE